MRARGGAPPPPPSPDPWPAAPPSPGGKSPERERPEIRGGRARWKTGGRDPEVGAGRHTVGQAGRGGELRREPGAESLGAGAAPAGRSSESGATSREDDDRRSPAGARTYPQLPARAAAKVGADLTPARPAEAERVTECRDPFPFNAASRPPDWPPAVRRSERATPSSRPFIFFTFDSASFTDGLGSRPEAPAVGGERAPDSPRRAISAVLALSVGRRANSEGLSKFVSLSLPPLPLLAETG